MFYLGEWNFIPVDSVLAIQKSAKSNFWNSAGIGFIAGAAAGLMIHSATDKKPKSSGMNFNFDFGPAEEIAAGVLCGLSGFLVGGIIGASSGEDEIYDLTYMTPKRKMKKIQEIIYIIKLK